MPWYPSQLVILAFAVTPYISLKRQRICAARMGSLSCVVYNKFRHDLTNCTPTCSGRPPRTELQAYHRKTRAINWIDSFLCVRPALLRALVFAPATRLLPSPVLRTAYRAIKHVTFYSPTYELPNNTLSTDYITPSKIPCLTFLPLHTHITVPKPSNCLPNILQGCFHHGVIFIHI